MQILGIVVVAANGFIDSLITSRSLGTEAVAATNDLLTAYIRGYAPGIIGQVLSGVLMVFLPFNNDIRRSCYGIATMTVQDPLGCA